MSRKETSSEFVSESSERVAIVGAGWYGCHIASQLKQLGYKITIFEKNSDIFLGASGANQFRLHKGLHYPRSYITRMQALKGFDHFMKYYSHLTTTVDYNLYGVSRTNSLLDFGTYKQVMDSSKIKNRPFNHNLFGLSHLEGVVSCDERVLYHSAPRSHFRALFTNEELKLNTPVKKAEQVTTIDENQDLEDFASDYTTKSKIKINGRDDLVFDWCISCTYNTFLVTPQLGIFYEPCITLIYNDIRPDPFPRVALTVCDGQFCSFFPYIADEEEERKITMKYLHTDADLGVLNRFTDQNNENSSDNEENVAVYYTLTSVTHTPLGQYNTFRKAEERRLFVQNNPETEVMKLVPLFEQSILKFYPSFKQHFQYHSYFTSMKTKPFDSTDCRECSVDREGRFIGVMSGKVNSLYVAEQQILDILQNKKQENNY